MNQKLCLLFLQALHAECIKVSRNKIIEMITKVWCDPNFNLIIFFLIKYINFIILIIN